jgi:hypothetical protein
MHWRSGVPARQASTRVAVSAEETMLVPRVRTWAWALLVLLMACTRWEPYPVPVAPAPALPSLLRVWATGRAPAVLDHPFVREDTLYGRSRGDTLGLALPAIERVERPRLAVLRTVGSVVGGLAAMVSLALLGGGWE